MPGDTKKKARNRGRHREIARQGKSCHHKPPADGALCAALSPNRTSWPVAVDQTDVNLDHLSERVALLITAPEQRAATHDKNKSHLSIYLSQSEVIYHGKVGRLDWFSKENIIPHTDSSGPRDPNKKKSISCKQPARPIPSLAVRCLVPQSQRGWRMYPYIHGNQAHDTSTGRGSISSVNYLKYRGWDFSIHL